MEYLPRRPRRQVAVPHERLWGQIVARELQLQSRGPRGVWPAAPQGAKYPLAHLKQTDVEPESLRMMSEIFKALRPFPEALRAIRERFAALFGDAA
jgi:hypothetical protein